MRFTGEGFYYLSCYGSFFSWHHNHRQTIVQSKKAYVSQVQWCPMPETASCTVYGLLNRSKKCLTFGTSARRYPFTRYKSFIEEKKMETIFETRVWRKCTYKTQNTHRGDRRRGHSLARDVGAPTEADGEEWKLSGKCCWPSTRRPKEIKNKQRGVQLAQHRIVYHLY